MVGLVFIMTDCLSEDDDEEHHPVYLLNRIAAPFTLGAGGNISRSNPESGHVPDTPHPVPRAGPEDITVICPVFLDRCSYGLMGI
ncbi:MAG: hypothetical protein WCH85_04180 [Methanomicrobiales archaeon]